MKLSRKIWSALDTIERNSPKNVRHLLSGEHQILVSNGRVYLILGQMFSHFWAELSKSGEVLVTNIYDNLEYPDLTKEVERLLPEIEQIAKQSKTKTKESIQTEIQDLEQQIKELRKKL